VSLDESEFCFEGFVSELAHANPFKVVIMTRYFEGSILKVGLFQGFRV